MDTPDYIDSPSYDRNPSPPPELLEHSELLSAESIGDTVFSKHWLFSTLMKLIEEVDKENEEEGSELVVDVDEELQNELCKLWDMSMNSEVAKFLNEFKAVEILTGIISKSKAPRVTEICVGILGNMACEPEVCKLMAENHRYLNLMLVLLESRDVPTLVECTRLMYTSLSNTGTQGPWIKAIQRSEEFLDHVTFIFSSSTNCDLLKNTAELVDRLLDLETNLCVSWATEDFIQSLLEATDQIGSNHSAALEVYLNIFQSFSTTEPGVEAMVAHSRRLGKKIMKYLNIVCEYEIVGLGGKEGPLASALSVLNILMNTQPPDFIFTVCRDEQLIRILLKILEPLYPILNQVKSTEVEYKSENAGNLDGETRFSSEEKKPDHQNEENIQETKSVDIPEQMDENVLIQTNSSSDVISHDVKASEVDGEDVDVDVNHKFDGLDEAEVQSLTVLHDVLSHFLLEYCNLVLQEAPQAYDSSGESPLKTNSNISEVETTRDETDNVTIDKKGDNSGEGPTKDEEREATRKDEPDTTFGVDDVIDNSKGDNPGEETTGDQLREDQIHTEPDTTTDFIDMGDRRKGDKPSDTCYSVLKYLDDACSRSRINYLGLILKETELGISLFEKLQVVGKENHKERLVRILNDVNNFRIVSRAESKKVSDEGD